MIWALWVILSNKAAVKKEKREQVFYTVLILTIVYSKSIRYLSPFTDAVSWGWRVVMKRVAHGGPGEGRTE